MSEHRLVLHVGLAKTATTTIQIWADRGRDRLAARGIHYPQAAGNSAEPKHQQLVGCLRDPDTPLWSPWAAHPAPTVFISAEGLTGHLDDFSPQRLALFRACHARRVSVFLNTRDEGRWLESLWRQRLFNPTRPELGYGTDITLAEFRHHPRVKSLLDPGLPARLAECFGAEQVVVARLEGDWAERLCGLLGVADLARELRAAHHANRGISMAAAELVRQINGLGLSPQARACCLAAVERVEGTANVVGGLYHGRGPHPAHGLAEAVRAMLLLEPRDRRQGEIRDALLADLRELASQLPTVGGA